MDSEEILELVKEGVIEPDQIEDFEGLDEEVQQLVADGDLDIDDAFFLVGDYLNLETPIRDAIVLALPINPLCDEECEGLCVTCGEKWELLPDDHAHEVIDARWTGLANWEGSNGESPGATEK